MGLGSLGLSGTSLSSPGAIGGTTPSSGVFTSLDTTLANGWTKSQYFVETTLTSSSASIAWNLTTNMNAVHTLTENTTLAAPSNITSGKTATIRVIQAASAKTLLFDSSIKWSGAAPTVSTGSGAIDIFTFYVVGSTVYGAVFGLNFI